MTTSLASQLNALKVQQRDALQVPKRIRISFLFDSKQAATIDDQTLFYICKAGMTQLKEEGLLDLAAFEGNLLNEKSLSFYRGSETKEVNDEINDQLEALLKALSPFLIEQSALKVVEYLLRIYEVHIYQKQTLILAFMPLFETVYFLRITQCLNLKTDQVWGWLNDFAYQGQSIDKATLIKCLARQNGLVFTLCAKFCLEVLGQLHIKWFGAFLCEVLKAPSKGSEGLMYNVLPLISQSFKQSESRDLRLACNMALCQISCRQTLTAEYVAAFISQLMKAMTASDQFEFDEDLKVKNLTSILVFTQYQTVIFDKKQLQSLLKIKKLEKLLNIISKQFDISSLCRVVLDSMLTETSISESEAVKLLSPLLNLKSVFLSVQSLLHKGCTEESQIERVKTLLDIVQKLKPDHFKQSTVFVLKQVSDAQQRDKILTLLGQEHTTKFGQGQSGEFSILSALGSHRRENRNAALEKLCDVTYTKALNEKETQLVHLVLLQLLEQTQDQESLSLLLSAITNFHSSMSDIDFQTLISLYDRIAAGHLKYSNETCEKIANLLCSINLKLKQNQYSQVWLFIQQKTPIAEVSAENPFRDLAAPQKGQKIVSPLQDEQFIKRAFENSCVMVGLFTESHACFDYQLISKVLRRLAKFDTSLVERLWFPLLSQMKKRQFNAANEILSAAIESCQQSFSSSDLEYKFFKKIIGVSLVQKQWCPEQIDLQSCHKKLIGSKQQRFAEIIVRIAIESSCKVKRMFACQVLTAIHIKGKFQIHAQLSYKIMIGVILILLNDEDRAIRENGVQLASAVLAIQTKKDQQIDAIELFSQNSEGDKPGSAQKKPAKLTPMKSKSVSTLLQDLIDAKSDLLVDCSQLKNVLTKHSRPEVFEEILRTQLDYPSFDMAQRLIEVLALPQKHAVIFCLNISQNLQKIFSHNPSESYLTALGALISHLQECSARTAQKEILTSVTLPFLRYLVEKKLLAKLVYSMFDNNLLQVDLLKDTSSHATESRILKDIFKLYLKAALYVGPKFKHLFVARAQEVYQGEDLAQCFSSDELTLETILQLQPSTSGKLFDQSMHALSQLIQKFAKDDDSTAYLIELCCQVALMTIPNKMDGDKLSTLVAHAEQVWKKTQAKVELGLAQEGDRAENPFDEFMKESKENQEEDVEMSEDENKQVDLLQCLQVTVSVMNLLTSFEQKHSFGQIPNTATSLNVIADYLVQICEHKDTQAQSQIKSQLYHLYQSLLLRVVGRETDSKQAYTSVIVKYVQASTKLIELGAMQQQLVAQNLVLNTLKQLPNGYTGLVVFTLLVCASENQLEISDSGLIMTETNQALVLAQQVVMWQMDSLDDIQIIEEVMNLVHHVVLQSSCAEIVETQTQQLFKDYEATHLVATQAIVKEIDFKAKKKFLFLTTVIFTQWSQKDGSFLGRLSGIAGTETPTKAVQDQLLSILLSSYIVREQVQFLLQESSSQSLIRLQTAISKWQVALNDMMSLQIHVELVMRILDMQPLNLKTNFLCLLLDKITTYSAGWLSRTSSDLHRIIVRLIQKCIQMLQQKEEQPESLAQLLLAILSKTASVSLPKELQVSSLTTTMQFHKGTLQLQGQTILTEMTIMETYSIGMLDYFHMYLKHTLDGFKINQSQQYHDVYRHALLKSLVCISSIFLKFLTASQLEQIILNSVSQKKGQDELVHTILENIASEAPNHRKLCLQAVMNAYPFLASNSDSELFEVYAKRYFDMLLTPVIRRLPQHFISEHQAKFVMFFKQMYGLPVENSLCTPLLVECFNAFTLKLNEEVLRPIIASLTKWSAQANARKLVFFHILCGCLETLREFFVPIVKVYFDVCAQSLIECQQALLAEKSGTKKRTHSAAAVSGDQDSLDLLVQACKVMELNYKYDSAGFLQNDMFEVLCDPIANLFDLHSVSNYDRFVQTSLKQLIYEMDERCSDDSMWQRLNYALLMKTRSEVWQTRLAVLQVIDHLFDKMRERFLVILNDTIPFISELLEDENERVELAAKGIVNRIEHLTGESINEYLK